MEIESDETLTPENLIEYATEELNSYTNDAYRVYTNEVISLYPIQYSDFNMYDKQMKTERAKLSQKLGAANKHSKGIIIYFYALELSNSPELNMSSREAADIFKITVGRSMSKKHWTGLFKREANDISPYFTDKEYRKSIFAHPLVTALKSHMDEFEVVIKSWNKARNNPYQAEIKKVMEESKLKD